MKQHKLYLSKRNLLTLLSKLERQEAGDETACGIIKFKNKNDPFVNSMDEILVTAISDEKFYINRAPGIMHPLDEPK
jgi:hypothetical protein